MIKRSICIFPSLENGNEINKLRRKYDPLHDLIPPHITLVFPFISNLSSNQMNDHITEVLKKEKSFDIYLQGITGADETYLFLNVKVGNDTIIRLHDKLYSGILQEFLYKRVTYIPHITVGRFNNKTDFEKGIIDTVSFETSFKTNVKEIVVETIDKEERSTVESIFKLND
ncbi:2'-5' RNA ligase family protein [Bacillus spongiae]|uniref:2'-5' RNA ligase family protein n=1 Tax=Bacillus spongiae TaxID=2683610 RepID=A0ABU8HAG6_9BACI